MARDAEDIIVFKLGQLMVENAALTAQVETLQETVDKLAAEIKRLNEERG
jgi:cell division protein FtsB